MESAGVWTNSGIEGDCEEEDRSMIINECNAAVLENSKRCTYMQNTFADGISTIRSS